MELSQDMIKKSLLLALLFTVAGCVNNQGLAQDTAICRDIAYGAQHGSAAVDVAYQACIERKALARDEEQTESIVQGTFEFLLDLFG